MARNHKQINFKCTNMETRQTLINLIEKYGDYYEEERQIIVDRLNQMNEPELLESLENMINHYITKKNQLQKFYNLNN